MKNTFKVFPIVALTILLAGCATSGPKFMEMGDTISSMKPDTGRIYIYRTAILGAAIQPKVVINGEAVGKAVPKGFFYIDGKPGNYEILTSTEVDRKLSLTLEKGQVRFVRLNISMGFFVGHVYPVLVENETGEKEIQNLRYIGKDLKSK